MLEQLFGKRERKTHQAIGLDALPDLRPKVCNRCLLQDDHPEFGPVCEDGPFRGKHRLRPQHLWMGVVATGLYDVRSVSTAVRVLSEGCWGANDYVLIREFSDQEAAGLQDGSLTLTLEAVPMQSRVDPRDDDSESQAHQEGALMQPEPLFARREDVVVCYHCSAPAEVDPERCKPGEIAYKRCGACGESGILRENDLYQELHKKKTNTAPYEKSPYRGGRL